MSDEDRMELVIGPLGVEEIQERMIHDRDREAGGNVSADKHDGGGLHAEGQDPEMQGPFWVGPGYRGEYICPHGCRHGNHIHGCDGCCSRDDFPGRSAMRITNVPNDMKTGDEPQYPVEDFWSSM
jgi:hypothetical protein